MTTPTLETKVHDFLAQKRIAVAGVSRDSSGHPSAKLIYDRLKRTGHEVFAVNPNADEVEGDRCYHTLKDIPGGVDAVVIATRPEAAEATMRAIGLSPSAFAFSALAMRSAAEPSEI